MTFGWTELPISEVAKPVERPEAPAQGVLYRQIGVRLWGEGAYQRQSLDGANTNYKTLNRVESGDIIVNKIWARNGSVAVVPDSLAGCYCSGEFPLFLPKSDRLEPRWFHWVTKTTWFWHRCDAQSRGTSGKNRIRPENFLAIRIPVPPLQEQRRIVARVEELAAKIEEAFRVRQSAGQESATLLQSRIGEVFDSLEKEFPRKSFGSFEPHVTSGPRNWATRYNEQGYRFYRAQDIGPDGRILNSLRVFIDTPDTDQGRGARLVPGDLMIVITGATVGRCTIFREEDEPGFVSQHVALCRLPASEVEARFALWALIGPQGQRQLLTQRYGQGKPGLNLRNIRSLEFPFPPIEEQRRIVAYLDDLQTKVDALNHLQAETATELEALLPSVLDKAFKGEL